MNLNQLRFARAIADTGSFSKAAEQCHVTQPTLSNGISQLEEELRGRLFERTTRSVHLTPLGEHLLPMIVRVLSEVAELHAAAHSWREPDHKLIRIGLSPMIDMRLLAEVLEPFCREHPDVEIFFKECFLGDLDARLSNAQVDLALLPHRQQRPDRERFALYDEPLYYVPRDGGSLQDPGGQASLSRAAEDTLVLTVDGCGLADATRALFHDGGYSIHEYQGQAVSYKVVEDWASLGIGAGILPRSKVSPENRSARPLLLDSGEPATITCEAVSGPNAA